MKELKREIANKYTLALLIIALLNCASFILLQISQNSTDAYSNLINKSGLQRMLSQRISLITHQLAHEEDPLARAALKSEALEAIDLFEKDQQELDSSTDKKASPTISEKTLIMQFIDQSRKLVSDDSLLEDQELSAYLLLNKNKLLSVLNSNVKAIELESLVKNDRIKKLQVLIFAISLITLIFILFLVFKPMERQILARQDELNRAKKVADEQNRYKSLFLANMSHELRTPLNGVLGVADLLASTQLSTEQREYLQVIDQSGNTLLAIINDILDATKIEMNGLKLERRNFSTAEFCSSLEMVFHYQFLGKHVELIFETKTLPPALFGDDHRLKQIFTNLLSNALKFTEKGSVTLELIFEEASNKLHFSVQDTGIGIDPTRLEGIFEPFKQEDSTTTRIYGGTGLGLTITRELVEAMNGQITIDSSKGLGSKFFGHVILEKGEIQQAIEPKQSLESIKKAHVLIVDDNDINLKLLSKLLEKSNLTVAAASSGAKAIEMVKKTKFDLILMDYHMPVMNGTEAAKKIKKELGNNAPNIICLTADLSEQANQKAKEAGIIEVVEKPIRKHKLIEILSKYIA